MKRTKLLSAILLVRGSNGGDDDDDDDKGSTILIRKSNALSYSLGKRRKLTFRFVRILQYCIKKIMRSK